MKVAMSCDEIVIETLGIGPGDEVIVSGYTFIASISSIIYAKAIPVFAEIDNSLTLDPDDIERKITKKTKAIMPVHMLGNSCNMYEILKIVKKNKLYAIEDACQVAGASYKGRKVGSIGGIEAYSLNVFKTISAGDGGLVVTDDILISLKKVSSLWGSVHKPSRMGLR